MLYLCYNRSVVHKEDSLQTNTNTNTYVGTNAKDGGAIKTLLVQHAPA